MLDLVRITASYLTLIVIIQTINHTQVFKNEHDIFSPMTLEEKNAFINKTSYLFAKEARNSITKSCSAEFVSDWDIEREPFMGKHRQLAFFLYPKIDIRSVSAKKEKDCIVYFNKDNAQDYLPEGFKIVFRYDNKNILAVRELHP